MPAAKLNVMKLFNEGSYSNCGLEIWGFGYEPEPTTWSMQTFAQKLDKGYAPQLRRIVAFSGNSEQKKNGLGPHTLAAWLEKEGETVHASKWEPNHGQRIRSYFWYPSVKFRGRLNKAWKALPKENKRATTAYY